MACGVRTAAATRTLCRHHFPTLLGLEDAATRHRLLPSRGLSRWFSSSTDTPVSSGAAAEAPRVSEEKPAQSSPAALKRLLKISLPGASRAEPPQATTSAVPTGEALETTKETAAAPQQQQQQQQQQHAVGSDEWKEGENGTGEFGFKYKGPEPTMHGDWAHKGRVTDF
ncbi:hypothetical protein Emed_004618 [Eimeria media]